MRCVKVEEKGPFEPRNVAIGVGTPGDLLLGIMIARHLIDSGQRTADSSICGSQISRAVARHAKKNRCEARARFSSEQETTAHLHLDIHNRAEVQHSHVELAFATGQIRSSDMMARCPVGCHLHGTRCCCRGARRSSSSANGRW